MTVTILSDRQLTIVHRETIELKMQRLARLAHTRAAIEAEYIALYREVFGREPELEAAR